MAHPKTTIEQVSSRGATRPPVVVVMGHVDHGKSSLLEAIREDFRITSQESGGITQHIGAYQAEYQGKSITFIDTPGHEAFSAMRSRGARVADIAILVVAADEGIKPQTKEALNQIKTAGIPFIVALNKIDKPEANPERIKMELAEQEILVESFGGQVPSVGTSALTKQGIPELLETILLMAELEPLMCNPLQSGTGLVIEASVDSRRGNATTLLVQDGTIRTGDFLATRSAYGKIKIIEDFQGRQIKEAGPAMPAVVIGFEGFPRVGEEFRVFPSQKDMLGYAALSKKEEAKPILRRKEEAELGDAKALNVVLKADVAGSLEALEGIIQSLPRDKVAVRVIKAEVGDINEGDVKFAQSGDARIVGFRAKAAPGIRDLAERSEISIDTFDIIYDAVERLRKFMEKIAAPEIVRAEKGKLKLLAVFGSEKGKYVVGGRMVAGELRKGTAVEIVREEKTLGEGKITNLQHNKQDVSSIAKGQEAGILLATDVPVQAGDTLVYVAYEHQKAVI